MDAIELLKSRPRWVAWRYATRKGGKPTKPPVNPHTGKAAKINDPSTWGTYEEASKRAKDDELAGIGYVIAEDDELTGADLDHVRDAKTGQLVDWARAVVELAETYCEVSPSGTGLRLFWLGKIEKSAKDDKVGVELYRDGRYLTITGQRVDGCPDEIRPAPATLEMLTARLGRGAGTEEKKEENGQPANEWYALNTQALQNMLPWVPALFGDAAKRQSGGGYRISSKGLGRSLQEDLSLTPEGIVDFGIADMGDPRQGKRTPINLVMEHKKMLFNEAVEWLCERLGVPKPETVLSPGSPFLSAREIMRSRYTDEDATPLLRRHRGTFWLYERGCHRLVSDERVKNAIWRFLDGALKREGKGDKVIHVPFNPKTTNVSDVFSACQSVCELDDFVQPPAWLEEPDMAPADEFMSVKNGLLRITTGELFPHTPKFFGHVSSPVEYDADAPSPEKWLAFLKETIVEDDAIATLQEWMGYTLTTDTSQQKMLLCVGPRRSGKGTVARVHTAILGQDSVGGPTMSSLAENFGLEPLITQSLAIISDARIGGRSDKSAIVERLLSISGEDTIIVPRKYLAAWVGRLPARFEIMTNELPAFTDGSAALAGRFLVIQFRKSFYGREDAGLTSKLVAEASGILNWSIEGYRRLRDRGYFVKPKSSEDIADQLETLSSPTRVFVEDFCIVGDDLETEVDVLYAGWQEWCEAEGRKGVAVGTREWFCRNLRSVVPNLAAVKRRNGNGRVRCYRGIGLSKESPEEVI